MQQRNATGLMRFAGYARRIGVNRSTVKRWVDAGVISTVAGRIDPAVADRELQVNRPIARGRAAWRDLAVANDGRLSNSKHVWNLPASSSAAAWVPTPRVLGALRAHGVLRLAARLESEGLPPAVAAVACAHLEDLIDCLIYSACLSDSDPGSDGTLPPPGAPALAGVDYAEVVNRIRGADATADALDADMDLFSAEMGVPGVKLAAG